MLVKGSNYLETLSKTDMVVFDKTGTLTQGVFEVNGIHHNEMENEKLLEYAAHAECASSHPISRSLQRAYGKEVDRSRVENIREISEKMIDTVCARLRDMKVELKVDDKALDLIAEKGFDEVYGARPLRREIQSDVEDIVAEKMLEGVIKEGDTADITAKDGKIVLVTE